MGSFISSRIQRVPVNYTEFDEIFFDEGFLKSTASWLCLGAKVLVSVLLSFLLRIAVNKSFF